MLHFIYIYYLNLFYFIIYNYIFRFWIFQQSYVIEYSDKGFIVSRSDLFYLY